MSVYYQQQNSLFPEHEGDFIEVSIEVPGAGTVKIPVPTNHPLVVALKNIDWDRMYEEIDPIIYKGVNKFLGRKLNLRGHCGIYLLQAMNNWTDRFSEEMLRYYAPARLFCGYPPDSKDSIDHTKIERFRNRLGLKKSRSNTDDGDVISGYRAGIGFNLKKMMNFWRMQNA